MMSQATVQYLEDMVGIYGTDVVDVMRSLIEKGVREAIREGFIEMQRSSLNE